MTPQVYFLQADSFPAGSSSPQFPFTTSLHDWEKLPMPTVAPYQPNAQEIPKHIFMGIVYCQGDLQKPRAAAQRLMVWLKRQ